MISMSTRTAIFKEQEDGTFQGIYCHHDGYIEGVGRILNSFYQDPKDIQKVIDERRGLSCLGVKPKVFYEYGNTRHRNLMFHDWRKFSLYVRDEYELYVAKSLEEIRLFEYMTLTDGDKVDGWLKKIDGNEVFIPFRGSDNNGYLYVQLRSGEWLVSIMNHNSDMTEFKSLSNYF